MGVGGGGKDVINEGFVDGPEEGINKDGKKAAGEGTTLNDARGKLEKIHSFIRGRSTKGENITIDFMDKINDPFRKASGTNDQENPIMRYRRKSRSEVKESDEWKEGGREHSIASSKGVSKDDVFNEIAARNEASLNG